MKRIIALTLTVIFLFDFTSCGAINRAELKNRLIIQGIGLDLADGNKLQISVQTLNTDVSTHASSNSEPETLVKLYSISANTLSEAVKKFSELTGKNPVLSQNRIVVFGSELAKRGVGQYLDDFFRNDENRFSVLTLVSSTTAKDIIDAKLGENVIPARLLEKIILTADENFEITKTSVLQLQNSILNGKSACVIPVAEVAKSEKDDKINIKGSVCFLNGKMQMQADENITAGINIVNGSVKKAFFGTDLNNGKVSFEILGCKTKIKTESINGKIRFDIKIKGSLAVDEYDGEADKKTKSEDVEKMTDAAEEYIKALAVNSIDECLIKNGIDVFGFSERLERKSETASLDLLRQADYNISVEFKIKRMGDSIA